MESSGEKSRFLWTILLCETETSIAIIVIAIVDSFVLERIYRIPSSRVRSFFA